MTDSSSPNETNDDAQAPDGGERKSIDGLIQFGLRPLDDDEQAACDRIVGGVREATTLEVSQDAIRLSGSAEIPVPADSAHRYELGPEIGRGGVGEVLSGRDTTLGRKVAVKILAREHANNPQLVRRFVEEAQIGGQLQHPGVVPVHEVGYQEDGRPFIAMKLVNGSTFAELLDSRPDPSHDRRRVLTIFEKVCQTIAFAHARGVVHRDLKPSNIMVGAYGEVQVMDWGLAKVLKRSGPTPQDATASPRPADLTEINTVRTDDEESHSETGSVMGTPSYMPPEQARGEVELIDERADVFALGGLLCQILTGQPPYTGERYDVRSQARRGRLDDAYERIDDSPADEEIKEIARACLQAEREDRPRDAGEVEDRYQAYRIAVDERAHDAALDAARARSRLIAAIVVGLAILSIGSILYWQERSRVRRVEQVTADVSGWIEDTSQALIAARAAAPEDATAWPRVETSAKRAQQLLAMPDVLASERRRGAVIVEEALAEAERAHAIVLERKRDRDMVARLQRLRTTRNSFEKERTAIAYFDAFREFGVDLDKLSAEEAARTIREATISEALLRGLDDLYSNGTNGASLEGRTGVKNLVEVLYLADTDEQRRGIRRAIPNRDLPTLRAIAQSLDPKTASAQTFQLSTQYLSYLGGFKDAIEVGRRALTYYPDDYWLNSRLAQTILTSAGDVEEALKHLEIARALRPDRAHPRVQIASILLAKKDMDSAEAEIRRAIEIDPSWPSSHFTLGALLMRQGKSEEALAAMRRALDYSPGDPHFHYRFGMVLVGMSDPGAEDMFQRVVDLVPNHLPALRQLGRIRAAAGDRDGAVAAYRALIQHGLKVEARGSPAAEIHRRVGYDIVDSLGIAFFYLAGDHDEAGRFEEAIAAYQSALDRVGGRNPLPGGRLAELLLRLGRIDEAAGIASKLIELRSDFPLGYSTYAETLRHTGKYEQAVAMHEMGKDAAAKVGMRYPSVLIATARHHDRESKAIDARGDRPWPDDPKRLSAMAQVLVERGQPAGAVELWKRVLERVDVWKPGARITQYALAAEAAGWAAQGKGENDDPKPDEEARRAYLTQSVAWLDEAADRLLRRVADGKTKASHAKKVFAMWRHHDALKLLRRENAATLPEPLRTGVIKLWRRLVHFDATARRQ